MIQNRDKRDSPATGGEAPALLQEDPRSRPVVADRSGVKRGSETYTEDHASPHEQVSNLIQRLAASETALQSLAGGESATTVDVADTAFLLRQAQKVLLASEARNRRLADILQNVRDSIIVTDLEGRITYWNEGACSIFGYFADEMLGKALTPLYPDQDPAKLAADLRRIQRGKDYRGEWKGRRKDGASVWVDVRTTAMRDAAGRVTGFVGVAKDITERKQAEEALRRSQADLADFFDNATLGLNWVGPDGIILRANQAELDLLGYTRAEYVGHPIAEFHVDRAVCDDILQRLTRGETLRNSEARLRHRNGSIIHVLIDSNVYWEDGKFVHTRCFTRDITNRKQAEVKVRLLAHTVESISEMASISDLEGRFLYANKAFLEKYGYAKEEIIGQSVALVRSPNHPPELADEIWKHSLQGGWKGELLNRTKDGREFPISLSTSIIRDASDQIIGLVRIARDITERRQVEEALRESEELFRKLSESSPLGIMLMDNQGRCTYSNPRSRAIFAVSLMESLGEGWARAVHAEDRTPVLDGWFAAARDGRDFSREFRLQSKDSAVRWVHLRSSAMFSDRGELRGRVATVEEITERKQAEELLVRERNCLRTLIDNLPDYIYIKDAQGRYVISNAAHSRLLGAELETQIVGKTSFEFFPRDIAAQYETDDQAVTQSAQPLLNREEPFTDAKGNKGWFLTSKVPLRDPQGNIAGLVGITRDITEKRNLEARLRQSQKMESIGRLAGGIAHDFNNILTVIQGHASLLLARDNLQPEVSDSAEQISLSADRAANLTRQLLTFSRQQVIQPKDLDLNEVVSHMTKMLQRILGEDISLQVNYSSSLPPVHADRGMMEQILLNLAVNSRDAMPKGGQLAISTDTLELHDTRTRFSPQARAGQFVRVQVRDTGCGIAAENMSRIFEPFFTTKDVGKGTGLGLATVYGIVQQHRGWIEVDSEANCGTTFRIFLPASGEKPAVVESKPAETTVRGGTETILLVEDEAPLRSLVQNVLERYGYTVIPAVSGVAALELWRERHEQIQLVLTDVVMPDGMTGRELAVKLQTDRPELKVIYTSGYSADVLGKDMVLRDGLNFLQKPYHPRKLAQVVRDCLDAK